MKTFIRGSLSALLLSAVAFVGAPRGAWAEAPTEWTAPYDAVLYELNENLSLRALQSGRRVAKSQLLGFAKKGSPLCPEKLAGGASFCTLNATGADSISLTSGLGKFAGTFTVVAQGDNPVDSPEAVVARGSFTGDMDFAPAILQQIPLGSVQGRMSLNGGRRVPFRGTFRLPFIVGMQDPDCVSVSGPTGCPMLGYSEPLYLLDPVTFQTVRVNYRELAIGFPTVRFEINFD